MRRRQIQVRDRHPSLQTLGIAVEHYPRYVNRHPEPHSVDVVLLSFIVRGRGVHHIDEERFDESGSSLAVTHYHQRHTIVTSPRGMEIINVYLDPARHVLPMMPDEGLQRLLPLLIPLHPRFAHRLNRIVRLQFENPAPLAGHLLAISRELIRRAPGYDEAVRLHWKLFLLGCCRRAVEVGFTAPADAPARLERLRQHLDHTFAEPHSLDELAKQARLSRTSLCRGFKNYTGKTVIDYLIDRRIQAAVLRLSQPGRTEKITSIALSCGFNDLAYFNRKFKQILGASPSQYRAAAIKPVTTHPPTSRAARWRSRAIEASQRSPA
jgi:AraC-like DNA-binding protein